MPSMEEYIEEIRSIWDSHWLTNMGEKHKALQAELQKYMGVPAVELLTNGHMALELSLQAMNLQGEVITTPFTFASTTHAIVRNGLEPVVRHRREPVEHLLRPDCEIRPSGADRSGAPRGRAGDGNVRQKRHPFGGTGFADGG